MEYRCPHCGGNGKLGYGTDELILCQGDRQCGFTGGPDDFERAGTEAVSAEFTGCVAKPVAEFTKAEFMQACWEMYREWQEHEGGTGLPDYEKCLHYIEVNGLPD